MNTVGNALSLPIVSTYLPTYLLYLLVLYFRFGTYLPTRGNNGLVNTYICRYIDVVSMQHREQIPPPPPKGQYSLAAIYHIPTI